MRTPSSVLLVLIGAAGSAAPGCSEEPTNAGPSDAAQVAPSPTCTTCLLEQCARQAVTCRSEPQCSEWLHCLEGCDPRDAGAVDPACEVKCPTQAGTAGRAAQLAFEDCRYNGAGATCPECAIRQPPDGGGPVFDQRCSASANNEPCQRCLESKCCKTSQALNMDIDGRSVVNCLLQCGSTPECQYQCLEMYPDGARTVAPASACVNFFCADACGAPKDPCLTCGLESCFDRWADCQVDAECIRATACWVTSDGNMGTMAGCLARYPAALARFEALQGCLASRCANDCAAVL